MSKIRYEIRDILNELWRDVTRDGNTDLDQHTDEVIQILTMLLDAKIEYVKKSQDERDEHENLGMLSILEELKNELTRNV